jgi:hypothetical protein
MVAKWQCFFYVLFPKLLRILSIMPFDRKGLNDLAPINAPSKKSRYGISWMG